MPQEFYTDGTPARSEIDDGDEPFTLILSGKVIIVAGGCDQVRIELTETQLRSLAYHATQAVNALKKR